MPSERQLGDIAEIVMGQSPSGDTCNKDGRGLPLLNGPTEFGPWHPYPVQFTEDPRKLAYLGDLLFCVRGSTTGRMNWADQKYAIGRGVAAIRGKNGFPTSFIRAVIETQLENLLTAATGSTFPNVGRELLSALPVPDCDGDTAIRIADVLEPIDARIWNLTEANTTLESIAQAYFKSWFIDFDPIHAKAEDRDPEGMNAETAALFPSDFEESELGPIPRGWRAGTLGDIATNPRRQARPDQLKPETPYIGLEHMPRRSIALNDQGTAAGLESGKFWFEPMDILFGKLRPYFHKVGLAPCTGVCSTDILVLRPTQPDFHGLLTMYASSDALIDYATRLSNGARMPRTSWADIAAYKIALPPLEVARAFDQLVQPLFDRILLNIETVRCLRDLRDTLLPRLISGKLRVPEAQAAVEEALA